MSGWFTRLMVVTATTQLTVFALRPALTYQALSLHASAGQIGLLVASFSVVSLAVAIPVGRSIDRRGERGYLMAGAVMIGLAVLLMIVAGRLELLMLASAALGLGQMLAMIACQTIIANGRDSRRRDARFANFTLVTSTSQFAAPAVAGLLIARGVATDRRQDLDLSSLHLLTVSAALVGLVAAVSLLRRPGTLAQRPHHFGAPAPGAMAEVLRVPTVTVALVVGFSVLSAADLLVAFLPAYGDARGFSPGLVGLLIAAHGLASIAVRVCMLWLLRRYTRRRLLTVCLAAGAASLASIPFVSSVPALFLLMLVSGAGIGLCQPVAISWVAGAVRPEVRGTAMSVRMAGNRLGQTVVPLGVASLAGVAGVAAAFIGPAALLLVSGTLVLTVTGDERPGQFDEPPGSE